MVFASAGRFVKIKQFDVLIKAFAAMRENESCELRIAGSGPEELKLHALAKRLGVAHRVHFLGWVDSSQMAKLTAEADCFVLANGDETFALPFAEAWMCGTICIGASNNPLRMYFDGERGLLFNKNDVTSLSKTMALAKERSKSASSLEIARWATDIFSEEAVVTKILKHF